MRSFWVQLQYKNRRCPEEVSWVCLPTGPVTASELPPLVGGVETSVVAMLQPSGAVSVTAAPVASERSSRPLPPPLRLCCPRPRGLACWQWWAKWRLSTFDLYPWGEGHGWHPETPASYESLPAPLPTQIPTLWIHKSGGRGRGGGGLG